MKESSIEMKPSFLSTLNHEKHGIWRHTLVHGALLVELDDLAYGFLLVVDVKRQFGELFIERAGTPAFCVHRHLGNLEMLRFVSHLLEFLNGCWKEWGKEINDEFVEKLMEEKHEIFVIFLMLEKVKNWLEIEKYSWKLIREIFLILFVFPVKIDKEYSFFLFIKKSSIKLILGFFYPLLQYSLIFHKKDHWYCQSFLSILVVFV